MKALRMSLSGIALLLLAGCAQQPASDAEMDAAGRYWVACMAPTAIRMDDGKSDPVSIAYGVEPACAIQYEKFSQVMLKGARTTEGEMFRRQLLQDMELKQITSFILEYRAKHRRSEIVGGTTP